VDLRFIVFYFWLW